MKYFSKRNIYYPLIISLAKVQLLFHTPHLYMQKYLKQVKRTHYFADSNLYTIFVKRLFLN